MSIRKVESFGSVKLVMALLLTASALLTTPRLSAQANNDPPPSGAILDLNGQPINHGTAVTESVNFLSGVANTNITFAFREDPEFIFFSDVSLTDITNPSGNLIVNGDFSSGSGNNATDWSYVNVYGATFGGGVASSCGGGLTTCWYDGAVQAYDAITQVVATNPGDLYTLSFEYSDNSGLTNFSALSTNGDTIDTGGNGADILAYAQDGIPPAGSVVPEPSSIVLLGTGALGLAGAIRRRFM